MYSLVLSLGKSPHLHRRTKWNDSRRSQELPASDLIAPNIHPCAGTHPQACKGTPSTSLALSNFPQNRLVPSRSIWYCRKVVEAAILRNKAPKSGAVTTAGDRPSHSGYATLFASKTRLLGPHRINDFIFTHSFQNLTSRSFFPTHPTFSSYHLSTFTRSR